MFSSRINIAILAAGLSCSALGCQSTNDHVNTHATDPQTTAAAPVKAEAQAPQAQTAGAASAQSGSALPAGIEPALRFARPGFFTAIKDGRLWVLREDSQALAEFKQQGEPPKSTTRIGAGPMGMSIRAADSETIIEYLAAKEGFSADLIDGRLWVLREGTPEQEAFVEDGPPPHSVTQIGAGPLGTSIRSVDRETIIAYLAAKPGFHTELRDGRIWVLREGTPEQEAFVEDGPPPHSVTQIGAGPLGTSIRSVDRETIIAYLAAKPGFHTELRDGRIWVLREGSEEHESFISGGPPPHSVTRIGAGPLRTSLRAVDAATIDDYLRTQ